MENNKYIKIIETTYTGSGRRHRMSRLNRAAQFSPFAALSGYEEIIEESARETREFIELSDEQTDTNDRILTETVFDKKYSSCEITYFVPDGKKKGGKYKTETGRIIRYDEITRDITLESGSVFNAALIRSIEPVTAAYGPEICYS